MGPVRLSSLSFLTDGNTLKKSIPVYKTNSERATALLYCTLLSSLRFIDYTRSRTTDVVECTYRLRYRATLHSLSPGIEASSDEPASTIEPAMAASRFASRSRSAEKEESVYSRVSGPTGVPQCLCVLLFGICDLGARGGAGSISRML